MPQYRNNVVAALWKITAELTDEDLVFLGKILDDWGSGHGDHSDIDYFKDLAKKIDTSFREYPYELYRGQSLDQGELEEIKSGAKYEVNPGSWSVDEDEAKRFAQGWRDKDKIGIVFSYTPKKGDVVLNLLELVDDEDLMEHTPQATIDTLRTEGEIILGSIDLDASNIYVDADQDLEIFG